MRTGGEPTKAGALVFHRLARFLALFAVLQIVGGHWVALQSVAWVRMTIDYAQSTTLTKALEKTFDGEHPCDLCHKVKEGRSEEQKSQGEKQVVKFEAVLGLELTAPPPVSQPWNYVRQQEAHVGLSCTPPTPPPLAA